MQSIRFLKWLFKTQLTTGYSQEDKVPIALRHLLPRQTKLHGLPTICLEEETVKFIGRELFNCFSGAKIEMAWKIET